MAPNRDLRPTPKRVAKAKARPGPRLSQYEQDRRNAQSALDRAMAMVSLRQPQRQPAPRGKRGLNRRPGGGRGAKSPIWSLYHDAPTRTDHVYSFMRMTLDGFFGYVVSSTGVITWTDGSTDIHPADGKASPGQVVFCWNPGYRSCQLTCLSTGAGNAIGSYDLGPGGSSTGSHYGVSNDPPITDLNWTSAGSDPSRARSIDSNLCLRIKCGASTYGTLIIGKMYGSLTNGTVAQVREALIADRHSVKRIEFTGGMHTFSVKAGMANRDMYGDWKNAPLSNHMTINEDDPMGGLFIVFETLEKGLHDPNPELTLMSNTLIQTELGLARNHLVTREKVVPLHQGACHIEGEGRSAGTVTPLKGGKDPKTVTLDCHAETGGAVGGESKSLRGSRVGNDGFGGGTR